MNVKSLLDLGNETSSAIKNLIIGLGLDNSDLCNPNNIINKFKELVNNFTKNVAKSFNYLVYQIGQNFITAMVTLASGLVGAPAAVLLEATLSELFMGSLVGGLTNMVAFFITFLPGMELVYQYLLVQNLLTYLKYRDKLINILLSEINSVVSILEDCYNSLTAEEYKILSLNYAIKQINSAQKLIGREITRVENTELDSSIHKSNIILADNFIDKAIAYLYDWPYKEFLNRYNEIKKTYNLQFDFSKLKDNVYGNIVTYWEALYDEIDKLDEKYATEVIMRLFPFIPAIIKLNLFRIVFQKRAKILTEKFPIYTVQISSLLKKLDKNINENINDLVSKKLYIEKIKFKNIEYKFEAINPKSQENSFLTDKLTSTFTLESLTTEVKMYESLILLFPSMWKKIKKVGSIYLDYLKAASKKLLGTKQDIESSIKAKDSYLTLQLKTNQWVGELELAKALLKPIISKNIEFTIPGSDLKFNAVELNELIQKSGVMLDNLKNFIINKTYNIKTDEAIVEPIDKAIQIAQKYITPLSAGLILVINRQVARSTINGLKAVRKTLQEQKKFDSKEIKLAEEYVGYLKSNKFFNQLLKEFEGTVQYLNGTPCLVCGDKIKKGNLSELLSNIEKANKLTNNVIDIINCNDKSDHTPLFLDKLSDLVINNDANSATKKLVNLQQTISTHMNWLQDQISEISIASDTINKYILNIKE